MLVALHATDMPFYDSRINVAGWVLLAGLSQVGRLPASQIPVDAMGGAAAH